MDNNIDDDEKTVILLHKGSGGEELDRSSLPQTLRLLSALQPG